MARKAVPDQMAAHFVHLFSGQAIDDAAFTRMLFYIRFHRSVPVSGVSTAKYRFPRSNPVDVTAGSRRSRSSRISSRTSLVAVAVKALTTAAPEAPG